MVTIDRINSDYTVFYDSAAAVYRGVCNKCGGSDVAANANKATVQQAVVTALSSGGSIFLKAMTLDGTVTYGSIIIIIEDYQGVRKLYCNNAQIAEFANANSYQTTATGIESYAPTGSTFNGRVVVVYSSHAVDGGTAIFAYSNAGWHFLKLF
jgi:hypothetical protein